MNKILLSALAGGVVNFLLGWLVYGILLSDFSNSYPELAPETVTAIVRDPMVMWAIALSCFVYALLLAVIYGRWANITTFVGGATAGAVIGFLIALSVDLSMYSMMKTINLTGALVDPFISAVLVAVTGGVVGWVLGYGKTAS